VDDASASDKDDASAPDEEVLRIGHGRIAAVSRYYDVDDANARLEELRPVLEALRDDRDAVARAQRDLERFRATNGNAGHVEELRQREAEVGTIARRMKRAVETIDAWDVTLRDIGTGLVDFPALVNGRPIWLCWKLGEDRIAWWHELDSGFGGRRPLIDLE
jgi:hypothetical protein